MKIALFADGEVGLSIAKYLMQKYPEDVVLVVTMKENQIYALAKNKNIPACVYGTEPELISKLPQDTDFGVLAWWPKIIEQAMLDRALYGFINTHPSLLPYNRGKHYNFWALVEQVPFGVTIHQVDSGIDTGAVIAQKLIPYDWCDNGGTLYFKAQEAMKELFRQTYPALRAAQYDVVAQEIGVGSFHRSSEIEPVSQIGLDTQYLGRDLINLLRARTFDGHPGCWFEDAGRRYEITIQINQVN